MTACSVACHATPEPLVRLSDLDEYRAGFERYRAGEWDDDRWTGFRVRFGVYGQRQPGVQMMRIKIPGGIASASWLRTVAETNRRFAQGPAHVTTRQDFQIYYIPLERTVEALGFLYDNGVTTREACGNTLRNVTACALAGVCPRERVDAGQVAARMAETWLRHPLVQNMPRKFKIGVSGCATDCGAASIHDLGLIAVEQDGKPGFRVLAGGGLGSNPRSTIEVAGFVAESDLSAALEALVRLHQRYSDRHNRNAARIKFVVARFGEEKFRALFEEEFARTRVLPQRPWQPLAWRAPTEAPEPLQPFGVVAQHDGRRSVVITPTLGNVSSDQLDALADIIDRFKLSAARLTRDQNIALLDVAPADLPAVVAALRAVELEVPESADAVPDVISCPGATTCRIAITNSYGFAREVVDRLRTDARGRGRTIRISGCHNSCGLHQIGEFGFHGMAKKIGGRAAPHYQIHLGGNPRTIGGIALGGPVIPARHATQALDLLLDGYDKGRQGEDESVRGWAERLGRTGILALLQPLNAQKTDEETFVDWGDDNSFSAPGQVRGECAAPVTADDPLANLADDALITMDRALAVDLPDRAREAGAQAILWATRRLLSRRGATHGEDEPAEAALNLVRAVWSDQTEALKALDTVLAAESQPIAVWREAVAVWIDTVRATITLPDPAPSTEDLEAQLAGI